MRMESSRRQDDAKGERLITQTNEHPGAEMRGAVLPGNSSAELRNYNVPEPGWGQVLLRIKSSTICGSDIRAIYREHLGKGPEGYQGVIAGHEPCGKIVRRDPAAGALWLAIA